MIEHVGSGRPDGWTLEMGSAVVSLSGSLGTVSFPTAFDYAPNLVVFDGDSGSANIWVAGIRSWTASQFTYQVTGQSSGLHRVNWIAFGYRGD